MTVSSTHLIIQGMLLDKSKGDSMSLVYLNILIALPLDYFISSLPISMVTLMGASILMLAFIGCEMLENGCLPD